jgi:hypothetical protein
MAAVVNPRQTAVWFCGHRLQQRTVCDETIRGDWRGGGEAGAQGTAATPPVRANEVAAYGAQLAGLGHPRQHRGGADGRPTFATLPESVARGGGESHELRRFLSSLSADAWHGVIAVIARDLDELAALHDAAPPGVAIGLELIDDPSRRDELSAAVATAIHSSTPPTFALVCAAAGPSSPGAADAALPAAGREGMAAVPLADRVRNEFSLPTLVYLDASTRGEDLDAVIAAGRADLAVLPRAAMLFRGP